MKIGIYLINIHHTFLSDFITILEPDKNEIHLFVSAKIFNLIKELNPGVENKVKSHLFKGGNLNKYNKEVSLITKQLDYLVITPNSGRKGLLSHLYLNPKCKYAFIDALFGDVYLDTYHLFNWGPVSNIFFKWIYKKQMKKADGIIFSSHSIMELMKEYLDKKMLFLPFNFFHGKDKLYKKKHSKLNFAITGTIEQLRKDYSAFFEAINLLIEDPDIKLDNIQFFFLGGKKAIENSFANNAIEKAKNINRQIGFELIKTFEEVFIKEQDYREHIAETDITLSPLNMEHYKYGKFCSGMSESIAFMLPGIYPKNYEVLPELESSSLRYKTGEDLFLIIKQCINDKDFIKDLYQKAHENSDNFSIENYRDIVYDFIKKK